MREVAIESQDTDRSAREAWSSIERQLATSNIDNSNQDYLRYEGDGMVVMIGIKHEHRRTLVGNLDGVSHFDIVEPLARRCDE